MPNASHTDIILKLRTSRARIQKLSDQLQAEKENETVLLGELQVALGEEIGQSVVIGRVSAPVTTIRVNHNTEYKRDEIMERIVTLRDDGRKSFEEIATILNTEGFKPLSAKEFRTGSVHQMYKNRPTVRREVTA